MRQQRSLDRSRRRWLRLAGVGVLSPIIAVFDPQLSWFLRDARANQNTLTPFSTMPVGDMVPSATGWQHQPVKGVPANRGRIVGEPERRYLLIESEKSGSAWGHKVTGALQLARRIRWQWSVRGEPRTSRLGNKATDDFAARLFVLFDYPLAKVPWGRRLAIRLARLIYDNVPAAAICYVWIPGESMNRLTDSPYTSRLKMIVAGTAGANGHWEMQERDIGSDFQRAFGAEFGPGVAPIDAIVLSADTDQTGGRVDAGFSDISLGS